MPEYSVGSLVKAREREWVVISSPDPQILMLRPLSGSPDEVCGIYKPFLNLRLERVEPATFPLPSPDQAGDAVSARLLWDAARLLLRDGAGPFRSFGRISVRPRPYQLVPLLMALRMDPVRLFIADDVGVGKTIEALLIARELIDRGSIRRFAILCPPYLTDQWKEELAAKFHLEAVVVRSSTIHQLEREIVGQDQSVFGYYPYTIVSIDYAKSERHRANFLQHCPELVIVDEVHGDAQSLAAGSAQQQRHQLLHELARQPGRHLVFLSATPHSGIETAFLSLLRLLKPEFAAYDLDHLAREQREELARHFVQRRRPDVSRYLGEDTPFPKRIPLEVTYNLSSLTRELFERVYDFTRQIIPAEADFSQWRVKIRYYAAIALLRCVLSSPAAALSALQKRGERLEVAAEAEEVYDSYIQDAADLEANDTSPSQVLEQVEEELSGGEQRSLREFRALAQEILETKQDKKVEKSAEIIAGLLRKDHAPIVWCRYIATSDYVRDQLQQRLGKEFPDLQVASITGAMTDDQRRLHILELGNHPKRVLVATDCLSEGINLQQGFNAVLHYDLPWNPNRLDQREGRVDRFGQTKREVPAVLFYGEDNKVDGAVLDVLLRKALTIRNDLGYAVPIPTDSEAVISAVLKALFWRGKGEQQLLFDVSEVVETHRKWDRSAEREKQSRAIYAQRSIHEQEVADALKRTDDVLGDPAAVQRFFREALARWGVPARSPDGKVLFFSSFDPVPDAVKNQLPTLPKGQREWLFSFQSPSPEGTTAIGRNHPLVSAIAQDLLEGALSGDRRAIASRAGVIKASVVARRTVLLLLRLRFLLQEKDSSPLLAEEMYLAAVRGSPPNLEWLPPEEGLELLERCWPDAVISPEERREVLEEALRSWPDYRDGLKMQVEERAGQLEQSHRQVRSAARISLNIRVKVPADFQPDLLGLLVLQPIPAPNPKSSFSSEGERG
ncbi:MAG: DEAD/DEAH box helicase [bacterium]